MRKLKRLWLCRMPGSDDGAWYGIFVGRRPRTRDNGEWFGADVWLCPRLFHAATDIRLAPGDGPVEAEPMKLKGGK